MLNQADAGAPAIAGYEDLRVIGRGGFATVYQARQPAYDRTVAVKVVELGIDDEAGRRRFHRECAASGRLTGHPNILSVLDAGFLADGRPYLTMPLCSGGSVATWLEHAGPLPIAEGLRIGVKIAGALQIAHNHGVVHRDVKPANILLNAYGEAMLADFGIATIATRSATKRTQAYTPNHAPPEVLLGELATEAADIYTLGSTLYELLNGASAFTDTGQEGLALFVDRVLNSAPPPLARPDAPASLSHAIGTAMAKRPADRYPSAAAFGQALQDVQRELGLPVTELAIGVPGQTAPVRSQPVALPAVAFGQHGASLGMSQTGPARRRSRTPLLVALGLGLLLVVGGAITAAVLLSGQGDRGGEYGRAGVGAPPSASTTDDADEPRGGVSAGERGESSGETGEADEEGQGGEGAADAGVDLSLCPASAELSKATGVRFGPPEPADQDESLAEQGTGCIYDDSRLIFYFEPGLDLDDAPGSPVVISGAQGRVDGNSVAVDLGDRLVGVQAQDGRDVALAMAAVVVRHR